MNFSKQEQLKLEELAREIAKSKLADGEHQPTNALIRGAASGLIAKLTLSAGALSRNATTLGEEMLNFPLEECAINRRLIRLDESRKLADLDAAALIVFVNALNQELAKTAPATEGGEEVRS